MRLLPLCIITLLAIPASAQGPAESAPESGDSITVVQKRPLRQARRLEVWTYGAMSIGDPYLQRWGGGVRPLLVGGIGERLFLGENLALTLRVGANLYAEHVKVNDSSLTKAMGFWNLAVGFSFYLPGGERR